ncbi:MAG TPA: RpoL/Rpb11 RNA polymerase subunit family protein [Candidatus Thermoplasmatota archaeon]|nr:RpoL/Rpb11 RNA polymerase subunit family protein [Candidatus Thermoplasmatota archaeon]
MEVKLVAKDKDSIEVEIPGETETLFEPLRSALLRNPNVKIATYHAEHPWFDAKRLYVKVSDGKPAEALRAAAREILEELDSAIEQIEKMKEP